VITLDAGQSMNKKAKRVNKRDIRNSRIEIDTG